MVNLFSRRVLQLIGRQQITPVGAFFHLGLDVAGHKIFAGSHFPAAPQGLVQRNKVQADIAGDLVAAGQQIRK